MGGRVRSFCWFLMSVLRGEEVFLGQVSKCIICWGRGQSFLVNLGCSGIVGLWIIFWFGVLLVLGEN